MNPNSLSLLMLLLLGMASILMIFIRFAFRGRRDDPAFIRGFYLSMTFVIFALVILFFQLSNTSTDPLSLLMLLLLGMASILMIFIGFAFMGNRQAPAFIRGFYLSMSFVIFVLLILFSQLANII
jgi:hypothetical protein